MKFSGKIVGLFTFLLALSVPVSFAEDKHHQYHETSKAVSAVESLSPELRALLTKEMYEIQKGMMAIIPAYAAGNWGEIEAIGNKIEHSYILKQNITEAQVKELHSTLPKQFIKLDKEFHYFAGMLSHAAKKKKPELVGFYFSKLNESCVSCHSQYATHKFQGFGGVKDQGGHSH